MAAFHERLQEAGLKSTRQRDVIAERFFELDQHISAEDLHIEVRRTSPRVGYATVYRTLKLLVEHGFAVEKDFGEGFKRYDPVHDQDPHHDHMICVECRRVVEFDDAAITARLHQLAEELGFRVRRKQLELYVECARENCEFRDA